jgi:hypothetical protein
MLDAKTIRAFGLFLAFEYRIGLSSLNFDKFRLCLSTKASRVQSALFFLNLTLILVNLTFEGVSLLFELAGERKPSDLFWLSIYSFGYAWIFFTAIELWWHKKIVVGAFNCSVNFANKIETGKTSTYV